MALFHLFNVCSTQSNQKYISFNVNVDVRNSWKWVPFLHELVGEKNLNFERSKLTTNGQKKGFVGHNRVHWDVFYRCQTILSPNMIVDFFEFMDKKLILAPVCVANISRHKKYLPAQFLFRMEWSEYLFQSIFYISEIIFDIF